MFWSSMMANFRANISDCVSPIIGTGIMDINFHIPFLSGCLCKICQIVFRAGLFNDVIIRVKNEHLKI